MSVAGFFRVWLIDLHFCLHMVVMFSFLHCACHNSSLEVLLGQHTPNMYWSLALVKVWRRAMISFVSLRVSAPWSRYDFILELKVLIFIRRAINFDLPIGLTMKKAACPFLHLASTSSSVVMIRLPRYVKTVTCSRISPAQLMLPVFDLGQILISLWYWLHLPWAWPWQLVLAATGSSVACGRPSGSTKSSLVQSLSPLTSAAG